MFSFDLPGSQLAVLNQVYTNFRYMLILMLYFYYCKLAENQNGPFLQLPNL